MTVGAGHVLGVASALLVIGLFGVLTRRDVTGALIGVVLMLTAGALALVGFSRFDEDPTRPVAGMAVALLVSLVVAAQIALGTGVALLVRRRHVDPDAGPDATA